MRQRLIIRGQKQRCPQVRLLQLWRGRLGLSWTRNAQTTRCKHPTGSLLSTSRKRNMTSVTYTQRLHASSSARSRVLPLFIMCCARVRLIHDHSLLLCVVQVEAGTQQSPPVDIVRVKQQHLAEMIYAAQAGSSSDGRLQELRRWASGIRLLMDAITVRRPTPSACTHASMQSARVPSSILSLLAQDLPRPLLQCDR